jgi:hypothetical protein
MSARPFNQTGSFSLSRWVPKKTRDEVSRGNLFSGKIFRGSFKVPGQRRSHARKVSALMKLMKPVKRIVIFKTSYRPSSH